MVLVDGDVLGVFGTERDFYAVDWTGDGELHAALGEHERFSMDEVLTLGDTSFVVDDVAPDGLRMRFSETDYRPPKTPLVPGSPAPDFSFRPFPDGDEISLSEFRGDVVLLDFWATWCVPCMDELPRLKQLYADYHDQGFHIVGVSLDTNEASLSQVLEEQQIDWPQYFDGGGWDTEIAQLYRVEATPHMLLLGPDGVIQEVNPPLHELPSLIEGLLGRPPMEVQAVEEDPVPPEADPPPEGEPDPPSAFEEERTPGAPSVWLWLAAGLAAALVLWTLLQGR